MQLDMLCCADTCLVLQAPLELLLGAGWSNTCQSDPGGAPRCSLPQLLGFCKLLSWSEVLNPTPASAAATAPISYSYSFAYGPFAGWACLSLLRSSGAAADLVLWALLRLQYKLFRSHIYTQVGAGAALWRHPLSANTRLTCFATTAVAVAADIRLAAVGPASCVIHGRTYLLCRRCLLQVVACMAAEAQANAAKTQQNWRGWYNEQVCVSRAGAAASSR